MHTGGREEMSLNIQFSILKSCLTDCQQRHHLHNSRWWITFIHERLDGILSEGETDYGHLWWFENECRDPTKQKGRCRSKSIHKICPLSARWRIHCSKLSVCQSTCKTINWRVTAALSSRAGGQEKFTMCKTKLDWMRGLLIIQLKSTRDAQCHFHCYNSRY